MTAPVLQFKRGLLANLPALRAGEPGFTTDSYDLYVGLTSETSTNKFFGSHRYWTKETISTGSGINLVEGTDNGSEYITIKAPDSLAGIVTYTFPGSDGTTNQVLATNGSGTLSFIDAVASLNIAGDTGTDNVDLLSETLTFAGTASEIETTVTTNQVQIGLPDNVVVGASLTVTGTLHVSAGSSFTGGETILSSATVSDLTSGSVVLVGDSGSLEDSLDLTFENSILNIIGGLVVNPGVSTFSGIIVAQNGLSVSGGESVLSSATVSDLTQNRIVLAGVDGSLVDSANLTFDGFTFAVVGYTDLDDVNVSGAATIGTAIITDATISNTTFGSGTAITGVDTDLSAVSASDDTLASAKAIKDYVDSQVTAQDLDFAGDSGTGAVDLDSQTFTIAGTASEIETSASGQTITIGLPDNVVVGSALTVSGSLDVNGGGTIDNIRIGVADDNEIDTASGDLTIDSAGGSVIIDDELIVSGNVRINGNDIQSSDGSTAITMSSTDVTVAGDLTVGGNDIKASDGTTALTFSNSTGAVSTANDLTVQGNLYVSGNTTQVNTAALTVEDRTIDLGIVDGSAPASDTTWDLGVLFNYYTSGSAKKSAVVWEHGDSRFKFASVLGSDNNGTNNDTPQLTVTTFAPIEIGSLWVNDCAGSSQVISCTGNERFLENITVDAGTF